MVYGKLGRYPISIDIKVRMIKFWCKLIMGKQSKLSHICYKLLYNNNLLRHGFSFWIKNIQDILNKSSLSYIWLYQNCISEKWLSNVVKMNLIDKFKQTWSISVDNSPKALNYRLYKKGVSFENDLDILKDKDLFLLCRFRTSNHRLPIEIGRWQNINRENRVCNLCQGRELGDEFHYLFECTEFIHDRARLIPQKYRCSPNTVKYCALMCSNSVVELSKLCKFIKIVNSKVCP
jgi:hypothetical protein